MTSTLTAKHKPEKILQRNGNIDTTGFRSDSFVLLKRKYQIYKRLEYDAGEHLISPTMYISEHGEKGWTLAGVREGGKGVAGMEMNY